MSDSLVLDHVWSKWNLPAAALLDLKSMLGTYDNAPLVTPGAGSESRQQSLVRLEAPKHRVWLTRNNVGVLLDANGRPVRFGLANESPAQNKVTKSGDLIGIREVLISERDVGRVIGQFVSIEMKHEGWKFNPNDKHEAAQLNWCNFVNAKGGRATFATGPEIFTGDWK